MFPEDLAQITFLAASRKIMLIGACNRRIDHDRWDLILP